MTGYRLAAATAALSMLTYASAVACPMHIEPDVADARQADAVVVGYVTDDVREISPTQRAWLEQWLANNPFASRKARRNMRDATTRARLTVEVDHSISGATPAKVTVYWYRMTNNGPPDRISGGYVFALRKDPFATATDGDNAYAVMQGICSDALVFRRGSEKANAVREMFGLDPEPHEEPPAARAGPPEAPPIPWPRSIVNGLGAGGAVFAVGGALWVRRRRRHWRP